MLRCFQGLPEDRSAREVGRRLVASFVERRLSFQDEKPVHYAEACAFVGALAVARLLGDRVLAARLVEKFEPLLGSASAEVPARSHVDDRVFGVAPLEIVSEGGDVRHMALGLGLAEAQWEATSDGITREARYWVDDTYMITALQVQAHRATRDVKFLDRAARTMVAYLERLQEPGGLFFHTKASPVLWGRGNGWAAAGLTELLRELPPSHPHRLPVLRGYLRMMNALVRVQDETGVWRQLLDRPEAWLEASGSAMFTYALVTGVAEGWLDPGDYGPPARAAWLGLTSFIDQRGEVREDGALFVLDD
jgi:rhamnogalacturonyl hydrolase YesR